MYPHPALRYCLVLIGISLVFASRAECQIVSVTADQSPPVPGVGHDYVHMLNETVNPATGAVNVRISVPVPPGRRLTVPFAFEYNSNSAHHFVANSAYSYADNGSYLGQGGWSYSIPQLNLQEKDDSWTDGMSPPQHFDCYYFTDYILTELGGTAHVLNISAAQLPTAPNCTGIGNPPVNGITPTEHLLNSGDAFWASTSFVPGSPVIPPPVSAADVDGTVYYFSNGKAHYTTNTNAFTALPDWIEDRNGNQVTFTDNGSGKFSITDTLGRTALSSSGFGASGNTVTVSGLSNPYTVTWGNISSNFTYKASLTDYVGTESSCQGSSGTLTYKVTLPEITAIQLPNGQSYQFQYDNGASGQLTKLIYPTGGYVRYVWGLAPSSDMIVFLDSKHNPNCQWIHDTQQVTDRYVSFDGTTEVLHQHFNSITTTYKVNSGQCSGCEYISGKAANMTTYDLVRGTNFLTTYTYNMATVPLAPNDAILYDVQTVPVENVTTYYDTNGLTLRTVTKNFVAGVNFPPDETIALDNGQTSQTTHTWGTSPLTLLTDQYEYDYGSGGPGSPLKHTHFDYASFGSTPIFSSAPSILDRPSDVIIYDGSGNRAAETDYSYDQTTVAPIASLTDHDENNYSDGYNNRGNPTTMTKQCFQGSTTCPNPVTTYTYDETGQVTSMVDPCGNAACSDVSGSNHTTSYSYTDNYQGGSGSPPGNTNAYLTTITHPTVNGVTQHQYFQYAYSDAQLTQSQDDNQKTAGVATNYLYNDSLRRLTETDFPDDGVTKVAYSDTAPNPSVTSCKLINGTAGSACVASPPPSGWIVTLSSKDGMGQEIQNQLTSDPDGIDYTDFSYDGMGFTRTASNPHRSGQSTTDGTATTKYDALGRVISVLEPDGSSVNTTYAGQCTTTTDEIQNSRQSCTDALGNLVHVYEDPSVLNYETDYTYNALDDLIGVTQKGGTTNSTLWRSRTFSYNSLSQLTQAFNPESGTINYTYDVNGNIASKVAPLPNQILSSTVTTNYQYDVLDRRLSKSYVGMSTSSPSYGYDGFAPTGCTPPTLADGNAIGRRTSMCDGSGATSWAHDTMGRIKTENRKVSSTTREISYGYNLDGSLASLTYPTGRKVTYVSGGAGRALSATDSTGPIDYISAAHYAPFGGLTSMTMGSNPITVTNGYNDRLQPVLLSASTTAATILSLCYDFHLRTSISIPPCSFSASSGDNGNVFQIVNNRDNNRTRNFMYDSLNRITQAYTSGPNWGQTFSNSATAPGVQPTTPGIDPWANLTNVSGVTGKGGAGGFACPANSQNQLTACSLIYDAAGNVTNNAGATYTYDAENRIATAGGATYLYDGDGNRMARVFSTGNLYWRDLYANTLLEDSDGGTNLREYIYFNGQRVARRDVTSNTVHYVFSDHLGSTSLITDALGTMSSCNGYTSGQFESDYYPYGGEIPICANLGDQNYKFTAKERDSESSMDMFGARYYGNSLGRFMTPDWSQDADPIPYADYENPQTLNLYGYVQNRPLNITDPDGHWHQECGQQTSSTNQNGEMVINANCHDVADWWNVWTNLQTFWRRVTSRSKGTAGFRPAGKVGAALTLKLIHSPETIKNNPEYPSIQKMTNEEIIQSLKSGAEPLDIKPDGRVMNGNTRLYVLQERGVDINSLGLQPQPVSPELTPGQQMFQDEIPNIPGPTPEDMDPGPD